APVENRLKPIWVMAVRSTSANLTSSRTSSAPTGPNVNTFTTFLEYAEASAPACLATSSVVTWPERTIAEREGVTLICSSGKRRCISSLAAVMSTSTRRSKLRERSSSSQMSRETSPGESPLTSTWVGVTTSASATAGSVTETRFSLSVVLIRRDFPTITRSGAAPGVTLWLDVDVVVEEGCAAAGLGGGDAGVSWFCEEAETVVAPSSKTAAASVRPFMNSYLCEDARANPSRQRADANACGMEGSESLVFFKLGLIPFAAANHFHLIGSWWRRGK